MAKSLDRPNAADHVVQGNWSPADLQLQIHHKVISSFHQNNHASAAQKTAAFGHILMGVVVLHQKAAAVPKEPLEAALRRILLLE